ncbi:TRAP transporter substrate-binding protein [Desulforhopalus singaporensis]|uniref:TRAP-type C4-dicarboxylate transport system, substrate-binding protein n=1 Tax=Desulforhopalus singaporensis TaxID=91360 RepID=A0A1H0N606_9BACT|nr:TRAP transporter substrate-binding protein [Desulforhopalus singaporensis]SDO88061.1 TRAP-type C4-dicarboxylate transport system, substrate-binding protein [Desulforhopalus singaporensis]
MRKRRVVLVLSLLVFLVISGSAVAENLKFSTWHPAVGREVQTVWIPMMDAIKEESGGKLSYTMYAGGALGKGPAHYDIIKNGLSDLGYFTATWTPGKFPLSEALSMAMWIDGKEKAAAIGNELYEAELKEEFADVHLLELNGCIQAFLWTREPVQSLEDVKGLKIRTPGGLQTQYIKNLGAEPVFMPLGDVYTSLDTGAIDGVVTCPPLVLAFKLHEVVKYGVVATFGCVTEGLAMNKKKWNKLDEESKQTITKITTNPFAHTGGLDNSSYQEMIEELKAKGVTLHNLDQATQDKWFAAYQQVTRDWVASQKDPEKAERVVRKLAEIVAKHGSEAVAVPAEWK